MYARMTISSQNYRDKTNKIVQYIKKNAYINKELKQLGCKLSIQIKKN